MDVFNWLGISLCCCFRGGLRPPLAAPFIGSFYVNHVHVVVCWPHHPLLSPQSSSRRRISFVVRNNDWNMSSRTCCCCYCCEWIKCIREFILLTFPLSPPQEHKKPHQVELGFSQVLLLFITSILIIQSETTTVARPSTILCHQLSVVVGNSPGQVQCLVYVVHCLLELND